MLLAVAPCHTSIFNATVHKQAAIWSHAEGELSSPHTLQTAAEMTNAQHGCSGLAPMSTSDGKRDKQKPKLSEGKLQLWKI